MSALVRRREDDSIAAVLWDVDDSDAAREQAALMGETDVTITMITREAFNEGSRRWAPLPTLTVDRTVFPADGNSVAAVTYRAGDEVPTTVTFNVNGQMYDVAVDDGVAIAEITAPLPQVIDVECEGMNVRLEAV